MAEQVKEFPLHDHVDPSSSLRRTPRILVIGAGVLGTVYAARLTEAGHDITVAEASSARAGEIRREGLVIEKLDGSKRLRVRVPVVKAVQPNDRYDLALVIVRKTHLPSVMDALEPTDIPSVLFMVSTAEGPAPFLERMGERALLGFPGAGGSRDGTVVRYSIPPAFLQRTLVSEMDNSKTGRVAIIRRLLDSAGFHTGTPRSMDGWLKSHEAFVTATGNATYVAAADGRALAGDRALVELAVRAIREVHTALDAAGVPVTPSWFRSWQRLPLPLVMKTFAKFLGSAAWELGSEQLISMRDEVEIVTEELRTFARQQGVTTPSLDELISQRQALAG